MRALVACVVVVLLLGAGSGPASADAGGACLGPGVGRAIEGLVSARAFEAMTPPGYRLQRLDVKPEKVELGYDDERGPAATVVLTVGQGLPPAADARGPHFEHRLTGERAPAPSTPARAAMLRAALLVDESIPAEELLGCKARSGPVDGVEVRAPAAFGLGMGAFQVAIVLAALALGVRGPRRGRRPP